MASAALLSVYDGAAKEAFGNHPEAAFAAILIVAVALAVLLTRFFTKRRIISKIDFMSRRRGTATIG